MDFRITTSNIYFAAALLSKGAKYAGVDRSDERFMRFTLMSAVDMGQWEIDWINGDLTVNARKYKDAIQQIKGVLYSR